MPAKSSRLYLEVALRQKKKTTTYRTDEIDYHSTYSHDIGAPYGKPVLVQAYLFLYA